MDLFITQVPIWISISFGLLMISIPSLLISNSVKVAIGQGGQSDGRILRRKIIYTTTAFFLLVGAISLTGFFTVNTLPPRVILFAAIPLFMFYILVVQRQTWFKTVIEKIKVEQLIQIHIFRFVGVYFYLLYAYDALPETFAMIGGTGDILTALFAIPTVYFLKKKARFARTVALTWNVFGLIDILSVITTAIIITRSAIENNEAGVGQFGTFPFSWIPTFAPATIVFLHFLIFKKLAKEKQ
ncbi:MAG: hypothetical protein AAF149_18805 [Bacteroidota bacterium]